MQCPALSRGRGRLQGPRGLTRTEACVSPVLVVFDWVRRQVASGVGQSVSLRRQTEDEAVCLGPQVAPEWGW